MLIKQNMEGGGVCGRSSRHWDEISLGSLLCYPFLAPLVGENKAFTERKLLFLANSQLLWGRVKDRHL